MSYKYLHKVFVMGKILFNAEWLDKADSNSQLVHFWCVKKDEFLQKPADFVSGKHGIWSTEATFRKKGAHRTLCKAPAV